jgi:DNA-binding transcriptional regulator LsrR (DeoR family)
MGVKVGLDDLTVHQLARIQYRVCQKFIETDANVTDIKRWIEIELGLDSLGQEFKREDVYKIVRAGAQDKKYLWLSAELEPTLAGHLQQKYSPAGRRPLKVRVVNNPHAAVVEPVALEAARWLQEMIGDVARRRPGAVHVGFSSGVTAKLIARALARLLKYEVNAPDLVLHALNTGFDVFDPSTSPISFFGYFEEVACKVGFVGFYSTPVVASTTHEDHLQLPGIQEAVKQAKHIDIIVTSVGLKDSPRNHLREALESGSSTILDNLKLQGWVGDVMFRPYASDRPIADGNVRAVTLFELNELVLRASDPQKHLLLAAAAVDDKVTKAPAILPLLTEESLRVCTHLCCDLATASQL